MKLNQKTGTASGTRNASGSAMYSASGTGGSVDLDDNYDASKQVVVKGKVVDPADGAGDGIAEHRDERRAGDAHGGEAAHKVGCVFYM